MPGAGCSTYRCCQNEPGDVPACWYYHELIGFPYSDEMDPILHPECYTGITRDGTEIEQSGCRECGIGCDSFKDDFGSLIIGALWVNGQSYLRMPLEHRFGRNGKNQIFDLLTNVPTLIQRQCFVEYASCYENHPLQAGYWVCWGHHACQCTPEPDWSDPCPTADPGYPVLGLTPTHFFFNYRGWQPIGGTSPFSDLFCRKFYPALAGSSPRNTIISVHKHGYNASFLRQREGLNVDALVPCAGFIAPSPCNNEVNGDCTYGGVRPEGYINTTTSSQGKFEEAWIELGSIDLRMRAKAGDSAQQVREKQLYADIMSTVIGGTWPDPTQPGGDIALDRLAMNLPSNTYLGFYERTWSGEQLADPSLLPPLIDLPYSRTRWGDVPVIAKIVGVRARMKLYLAVPHFANYIRAQPNSHWIKRFAWLEVEITVGVLVDPVSTQVTVGGTLVDVTNPAWTWGQGFDGVPVAAPDGNELIYGRALDVETGLPLSLRVPRKLRWVGRLGSFSDPVAASEDYDFENMNCEDLIDVIGTFRVPALATAYESNSGDRNQNYDGGMSFFFSHQP